MVTREIGCPRNPYIDRPSRSGYDPHLPRLRGRWLAGGERIDPRAYVVTMPGSWVTIIGTSGMDPAGTAGPVALLMACSSDSLISCPLKLSSNTILITSESSVPV